MRVAVLSRSDSLYCTRRLLERGAALGLDVQWLPILAGRLQLGGSKPGYESRQSRVQAQGLVVIPRIGSEYADHALAQLATLEALGARPLNSRAGVELARDKYLSLLRLASVELPVPHTVRVKDLDQLVRSLSDLRDASGTADVVIKPVHGAQGRGVMLARGPTSAMSVLEGLICSGHEVLVQEFLPRVEVGDYRLLVLDDRVIGAVRRRPAAGEFRSNVHRGGVAEGVEVDDSLRRIAIDATHALGLRFAGVDLVEREPAAPVVLEVNPSPGWEGLEQATGLDVAELVLRASTGAVHHE